MQRSPEQIHDLAIELRSVGLQVWNHLLCNPEISSKEKLPPELWAKLEDLLNNCPLCEFFFTINDRKNAACDLCPLGNCDRGSTYNRWKHAKTVGDRQLAASEMLNLIEQWDTDQYSNWR